MGLRIGFAAIGLLASSSAVAADLLPLTRGIYVLEGWPCKGAANAHTMAYWGGRNGLNLSKQACTINRMTKRGSVYSLGRRCRDIQFDGTFSDKIKVTIRNRTSFAVPSVATGADLRYRYCGKRVEF